jgi:transposase-like protein
MSLPAGSPLARRGAANNNAKLSAEERAELRRLYDEGDWTYKALAARFGISRSAVWYILVAQDEPEAVGPGPGPPPPTAPPPDRPEPGPVRTADPAEPIDWTPAADRPCPRLGRIPDPGPIRRPIRPGIKPRGQRTPPRIVQRIRQLHDEGVAGKDLARLSGLAEGTISEMVRGKTHRGRPRLPDLPGPKAGVTYRLIPGHGSLYALGDDETLWTSARGRWRKKAWTRPRSGRCHFRYAGLRRDGGRCTNRTLESLMREVFPERPARPRRWAETARRLARPLPEGRAGVEFRAIPGFPGYALGSDRSVLFSGPGGWRPKKLNGTRRRTPFVVLRRGGCYLSRSLDGLMREVFPELCLPDVGDAAR